MENLGEEDYFPVNNGKLVKILTSFLDINTDLRQRNQSCRGRGRGRFINKRPRPEFDSSQLQQLTLDQTISFDFSHPHFPPHINDIQPMRIRQGIEFDIISLLVSDNLIRNNTNGDILDFEHVKVGLNGKYVMICCFYVPLYLHGSFSITTFNLSLLSKELSSRADFEMVLVVKMRPNWSHDKDAFKHFVSGFSQSCLVVPFEHTARIDYICRSMGLNHAVSGLLVGPDGVVVQDNVNKIESNMFPFSDDDIMSRNWRNRTIYQLLGDSCSVLYRNRGGVGPVSVSVSELEKKEVVGLYLCGEGYDIPLLDRVYNECRSKQLEFEIVLVYTPFVKHDPPEVIEEVIGSFLDKRNISWWVLPFSYFVCKRLFKLVSGLFSDKLLILSRGKLVERDGEILVRSFGCDGYPFCREVIIERGVEKMKENTLESLLAGGSLVRGNDPSDQISVSHLRGRNVIVFIDSAENMDLYELIEKHYYEIKKKHGGFEVVFVNIDAKSSPKGEEHISCMPWLVFNPGTSQSQSVVKALSLWGGPGCTLVAFGEDGQICSLNAQKFLRCYKSEAFPFSGDLHEELDFWLGGYLDRFKT